MTLEDLDSYLRELFRIDEITDFPAALNGLQVEGRADIRTVAVAVDATERSIAEAIDKGADLLVVHHGLFWDGNQPVTGRRYRRLKRLIESGVGLYAIHLPLDMHPELGNNAVLARALGVEIEGRFGTYKGEDLGFWGRLEIRREALAARLDDLLGGRVLVVPGGPERIKTVGVITGGAASEIESARAAGLDAFITGEGAHHNYFDASEGGINLFLGGHYATETWGIRALAEHLEGKFGLRTLFVDQPTGL